MDIRERKRQLFSILKIAQKKQRTAQIKKEMSAPRFWENKQRSQALAQELSQLEDEIREWEEAKTDSDFEMLEKKVLFSGPHDQLPAILSIQSGAGGTESQDWAEMLLRMFRRFASKKGLNHSVIEISPGAEAGIKKATVKISGLNAFGLFRSEAGVHRLVRISPFDADRARHTSFALVGVIPEISTPQVKIDPKDLKIEVFRSRGHGGQGVNTTDSAVRITHIPSGIVATCQNERSQIQNRLTAMRVLQSRLFQLQLGKKKKLERELGGEYLSPEWGNQIRSYILYPYQKVIDHRTGVEISRVKEVLDGQLDSFVQGYLRKSKVQNLKSKI